MKLLMIVYKQFQKSQFQLQRTVMTNTISYAILKLYNISMNGFNLNIK